MHNPKAPVLSKSPRLDAVSPHNYIISGKDEPAAEKKLSPGAICTFNDLAKMSKIVFYSTKSGEGDLHYLSILVCA